MRRHRILVSLFTLVIAVPGTRAHAQFRDITLASRELKDADLEKFVAITRELTIARKGIPAISSPAGMNALREATTKAADRQGWASGDYSVVDARMKTALMHISMEKTTPVPADKRADVELARKWKAKIDEAKAAAPPK